MKRNQLDSALQAGPQIEERIGSRTLGFFLDFDGTLAPIAPNPESAALPEASREALIALQRRHLVCLLSGRDLEDLQRKIGLPGLALYYAGDHGYRIIGPPGSGVRHEEGSAARAEVAEAAGELRRLLDSVPGVCVEGKALSLSVHYRLVAPTDLPEVITAVETVHARHPALRRTGGKMVYELHPDIAWDKGCALLWLVERLGYGHDDICPICLGDDRTDEDTFLAARGWGLSVAVGSEGPPTTEADYGLADTGEVVEFLSRFL